MYNEVKVEIELRMEARGGGKVVRSTISYPFSSLCFLTLLTHPLPFLEGRDVCVWAWNAVMPRR